MEEYIRLLFILNKVIIILSIGETLAEVPASCNKFIIQLSPRFWAKNQPSEKFVMFFQALGFFESSEVCENCRQNVFVQQSPVLEVIVILFPETVPLSNARNVSNVNNPVKSRDNQKYWLFLVNYNHTFSLYCMWSCYMKIRILLIKLLNFPLKYSTN